MCIRDRYKNQHLAFRMVDLANEIEMAKYMVYKAACDKDDHKPFSASAAKAKLIAAETAMHVTTDAVQMLGGNGFMKAVSYTHLDVYKRQF